VASASCLVAPNSRLSGTDEIRLKNVTIKTFLSHFRVHHTGSPCRAAPERRIRTRYLKYLGTKCSLSGFDHRAVMSMTPLRPFPYNLFAHNRQTSTIHETPALPPAHPLPATRVTLRTIATSRPCHHTVPSHNPSCKEILDRPSTNQASFETSSAASASASAAIAPSSGPVAAAAVGGRGNLAASVRCESAA